MEYLCPLCERTTKYRLWATSFFSREDRVALRLMEAEDLCYNCWQKHAEKLEKSAVVDLLTSVMDDHMSLIETCEDLETERDELEKNLKEENRELTEALEDLKSRISDVLR